MHPRVLLLPVLLGGLVSSVEAGMLHITIGDLALAPGAGGEVDVTIHYEPSDALDPASVQLRSVDFEFRITGTERRLEFLDPQQDLQLTHPDYVFSAGSVKRDGFLFISPASVGNVETTDVDNDTWIGEDAAAPLGASVEIGAEALLLARLEVVPGPGLLAPELGDTFTISLIDDGQTAFTDSSGSSFAFASTPGTVTTATTVVPEPGSFLLALCGALGLVGYGWRRQRRERP